MERHDLTPFLLTSIPYNSQRNLLQIIKMGCYTGHLVTTLVMLFVALHALEGNREGLERVHVMAYGKKGIWREIGAWQAGRQAR